MLRSVLRAFAAACGVAVTLSALATPAAADGYVPDGCAGSVVYVCSGSATPPPSWWTHMGPHNEVPVTLAAPSVRVLPTMTVGGQTIGGVMVRVGGQTVPGASYSVGGPTQPVETGVVVPVHVCAFVTCLQAGTPVVVPGVPAPVVPVVVPATELPTIPVEVPPLVTVPTQSVPGVTTPAVGEHVVTVHVYRHWEELRQSGYQTCWNGGGGTRDVPLGNGDSIRICSTGTGAVPATAFLVLGEMMSRLTEETRDEEYELFRELDRVL